MPQKEGSMGTAVRQNDDSIVFGSGYILGQNSEANVVKGK